MEAKICDCVQEYIERIYQGGLIGISDIAQYCKVMEGEIYTTLLKMQSEKRIQIVRRYFCPEYHRIYLEDKESYCQTCDLKYSNNQIEVAIYIQPLDH